MSIKSSARIQHVWHSSALAACLAFSSSLLAQDLTPPGGGRPIEGGGPVDVEAITNLSSVVVRGIVSGGEPRWVGRVIYTHYNLVVQETLKGEAQSSLTVAVIGGGLDGLRLVVPGAPELQPGDELVFFGVEGPSPSSFKPAGTFDGVVQVRPGVGNSESTVAPRGRPEDLDSFLDEVRGHGQGQGAGQARGR